MAKRTDCYCAFCKSPRRVYTEKSIRLRHFFWSFLASLAYSFIIWQDYDPRSLLFFVVALMTAEVFVKIRWRIHIRCRNCGFDPVLYIRNSETAAEVVKDFLKRRQEDPHFLLKPPLNLPTRPPDEPAKKSQVSIRGKSLSRTL